MKIYFTSDTHFFHEKLIKLFARPFNNSDEVNDTIIKNWNNEITKEDIIYHIGDFGHDDITTEQINNILEKLNFKKIYLILGNHDNPTVFPQNEKFEILNDFRGNINNEYFHLYHYPLEVWDNSHKGSIHLYGHLHGALKYIPKIVNRTEVSVDCWEYKPIEYSKLIKFLNGKRILL